MSELIMILLKGLLFGITIAAIPGPIFFLIVHRTLHEGAFTGLMCGLGAVTADLIYASLAAIGLSAITNFLLAYLSFIELFGGAFLIYLGIVIFIRTIHNTKPAPPKTRGLINSWLATLLLTLTNPATVISYAFIFAGMNISLNLGLMAYTILMLGIACGATLIEVALIATLHYQRHRLSLPALTLINKVAGSVLFAMGAVAILRGIQTCC